MNVAEVHRAAARINSGDPRREMADRIAAAMGCRARHESNCSVTLCPSHENDGRAHRPSLAVFRGRHGLIVTVCRAGCSALDVRRALLSLGIDRPVPESSAEVASHIRDAAIRREAQFEEAKELWRSSSEIHRYSVVAKYLASRGLHQIDTLGPAIRESRHGRAREVLMLSAVADLATLDRPMARVVGLTTLSLKYGGAPVVWNGKKLRLNFGEISSHGVFLGSRIDDDGRPRRRVVLGEGIESVLSFMAMNSEPFGIACLGCNFLATVKLPRWIRDVVIASDHDDPGQAAAQTLAHRLLCSGVAVSVQRPKALGFDFNDVLRESDDMRRLDANAGAVR